MYLSADLQENRRWLCKSPVKWIPLFILLDHHIFSYETNITKSKFRRDSR